ncbi:MAG: PASTA domain-containing protein [Odoribacter sp.]
MKKVPAKLKFFLLNLLIALILVCGIATYILYRLDNYTQHGNSIAVPSFYGLNLQESHAIASHAGLRVLRLSTLYNDEDARPGKAVVEQYPAEESRVKENRLIHLIINAQNPEKIAFPNLQNAAYRR